MQFSSLIRSMGDPLTIIDSAGQACYSVRTVPDVAERLSLRAAGGGELAAIVRDATSGGFEIIVAGERLVLVRSRGLIRKQYLIDTPSNDISVYGDVYRGMYALSIGKGLERAPQVQVRRETAGGRAAGTFNLLVIIPADDDPARLLAMVLGVEYLAEDRSPRCWSRRTDSSISNGMARCLGEPVISDRCQGTRPEQRRPGLVGFGRSLGVPVAVCGRAGEGGRAGWWAAIQSDITVPGRTTLHSVSTWLVSAG